MVGMVVEFFGFVLTSRIQNVGAAHHFLVAVVATSYPASIVATNHVIRYMGCASSAVSLTFGFSSRRVIPIRYATARVVAGKA